ncbi:MAG TPA: hypothetical protein VFZ23_04550 [Pyrinomonadaceae bacterium]
MVPAFDRLNEIKLLEHDRFDIVGILSDFKAGKLNEADRSQQFWKTALLLKVSYAAGNCSTEDEIWNVSEWKTVSIEIDPRIPVSLKDLGLDLSGFKKERAYINRSDSYFYQSKKLGIALEVDRNEVERIWIFPKDTSGVPLCKTKNAKTFDRKGVFGDVQLEERRKELTEYAPLIPDLILSRLKIEPREVNRDILVKAVAKSLDHETLGYRYTVSAGRIIGDGPDVVWNLGGVKPGTYTITVEIETYCGLCSQTKTETILITSPLSPP